ncbi:unnamed protein product [Oppiella nova]|uniref:Uncharacterized protein n=1 Tax=Oppiella nova TaxID=334625 RepID=A0A7R9LZF0_9ACAR|nr:unnamed protein product [Oppiella nova]CAG2168454.1 unnamed protein product [Oppiella nova]
MIDLVHLSIPVIVFVISIYLVIAPIVEQPKIEYLYAAFYIVSGILFYIPFVKYKIRFPNLIKCITKQCQLLLKVVPCEYGPDPDNNN